MTLAWKTNFLETRQCTTRQYNSIWILNDLSAWSHPPRITSKRMNTCNNAFLAWALPYISVTPTSQHLDVWCDIFGEIPWTLFRATGFHYDGAHFSQVRGEWHTLVTQFHPSQCQEIPVIIARNMWQPVHTALERLRRVSAQWARRIRVVIWLF